tara:strand:- start:2337 stop:3632 length:1296 start_codon:yes stop_codon:yes gene_type:complete
MLNKIKNIVSQTDRFLYEKFGSNRSTKPLENIKEAEIIFSYLNEKGNEDTRFVGGCVRQAIRGEKIDDIDLATSLTPEEVKQKLKNSNIQVIDTGISHGTLTANVNKRSFEITTLRKDILTDGRHAKVEFTKNWKEDALRRDFTINAIYVDRYGRIFDPLNGLSDLKNGKIKFIGNAEERIQEDYLRILRYFRFFAKYSKENHDENVIKLIKRYINGLNKVSNERIFDELKKFFKVNNVYSLLSKEASKEIIQNIFPQFKYYERLKVMDNFSQKLKNKYDNYLILALVILDSSNDYEYFCHKYKTSNKVKDRYKNIVINFENIKNKKFFSEQNIKKIIYLSGKNYARDLLLFSVCANKKLRFLNIEKLINYIENCKIPKFPISGDDLKEYGYKTGYKLGEKLKLLEEKWIKDNFFLDTRKLKKTLSKTKEN